MFAYLKYFIYLSSNWNLRIAWHIIKEEIKGEKKYNINTTGADELKALAKKGIDTSHATIYMPVSYNLLEACFTQINQLSDKSFTHFLDIGCGKGRAMCVAAHYGFGKVTGIDFSKELCLTAEKNLTATKKTFAHLQYSIINNDAFYYSIPANVDVIFLFNPFDEIIMSGVVNNIISSLQHSPRQLYIIYSNPLHKELFTAAGFKELYHIKKMKYLESLVLCSEF